ncbi:MAG TPA: trehalose-6-phosphate synthase [Anaeromyxobacteraceae bacterium]|nr:trehalose-6-phosphate synthase [Anaeromyxobacteraceae bacterium]
MRYVFRVMLPLLVFLGAIAWGGATAMNATIRRWFERDVALRAQLVVNSVQEGLVEHWRGGNRARVGRLLDDLGRNERVLAVAACDDEKPEPWAATRDFPAGPWCRTLAAHVRPEAGGEVGWQAFGEVRQLRGGPVRLDAVPVGDGAGPVGFVVVVHDMRYVTRREEQTWRFAAVAFAVVAVAAAVVTTLVARLSWRGWTAEMQRLMREGTAGMMRLLPGGKRRRAFAPIPRDVEELMAQLAADQTGPRLGPWSAERLHQSLTRHLGGESVVLVANREPYLHDRDPGGGLRVLHPASGLVTALEPVMRACSGTWVAHGSGPADREASDRHGRLRVPPGEESYSLRRVWLTSEEERGYYYGFANEGLWPLCHVVHVRPTFRAGDWEHYQRVNRKFAEAVCQEVDGLDPIILVQDYHFALLPAMLRERLPRATIIAFWHIPWPNAERLGICPWAARLLEGLLGASVVGFQTQQHCNNFLESVDRFLESRIDRERQSIVMGGRETMVRPYPISVDWPNRWAGGAPPVEACRREVFQALSLPADARLGVGVDRLDYTKGIEERLLAVERALERFPSLRGRFTFAQLAAPSRTAIESYRALNEAVERLAARINERFGSGSYRPIALLREHHEPPKIFRYYRAADLCYVSSLHDGMNLVAKEFVAARDDERGVLLLSRFTGAARELPEALLVNPYDLEEASEAMATALSMAPQEQADRMRAMRAYLAHFNVYRWAGRMLADAAILRQRDRLAGRLGTGERQAAEGRG